MPSTVCSGLSFSLSPSPYVALPRENEHQLRGSSGGATIKQLINLYTELKKMTNYYVTNIGK